MMVKQCKKKIDYLKNLEQSKEWFFEHRDLIINDYIVFYEETKINLDNSYHMNLILQSFLDYSLIGTKYFSINIETCNIVNLVESVKDIYLESIESKNIKIKIDYGNNMKIKEWFTDIIRLQVIIQTL